VKGVTDMAETKIFQTLDLYLASFLAFHGIEPSLETVNGKVIFVFPANDSLYRLIAQYNADAEVPSSSFVTVIKMLRGQMLSMRGAK
jgi:hypothetical protein